MEGSVWSIMGKHKELAKNTVIMMIGKIFTQFLSFFLIPLYTHMLPVSEYGTVDLIITYITLLVPVVTIQQEMATFRYLIDARGDRSLKAKIVKTSLKSTLIRITLFIIPYLIIVSLIQWSYALPVVLCGIFTAFSNLLLQIARGFGENLKYTIGSVISGVITIVCNLLLICVCNSGAQSILVSMALANMCCGIYLFFSLNIVKCLFSSSNKELQKKMLKYSWPLVPNGISWWFISASDRTIVSMILGVAANGVYAIALKFPSILSSFLNVFILSWTESASVHINDKDKNEFFSSVANNTIKIFSSLGVLVIAFLPFVFDIIIGKEYRNAYEYIPIAVLGVLFNCLVSVYSAIYVAKKMSKQVATTSVFAAIINIVVDLALINFIGLYAAVISTAVAYLIMSIYRHFDLKKYVSIRYSVWTMLFALFGLVFVSFVYYYENDILYIVGAIFAVCYAFGMNWKLIKRTAEKGCKLVFRRQ